MLVFWGYILSLKSAVSVIRKSRQLLLKRIKFEMNLPTGRKNIWGIHYVISLCFLRVV